jgi:menaquinone-specific isochorismate synthase
VSAAAGSLPALNVRSEAIADPGSLVALLEPRHPLAFLRRGDGIVGLGEALRLEFSGPERFIDAAETWRELTARATESDPIGVRGSGLVAIGSFAFSDESEVKSVLIVPSVSVARRHGVCWITRVDSEAVIPPASSPKTIFDARFTAGQMTPDAFLAAVRTALERIAGGAVNKVVIARDLQARIPTDADLRGPIDILTRHYPETITYAIDGLIGSSPETLVRSEGRSVSARVLAGSVGRGQDASADELIASTLRNSPKDLDEHGFAIASMMSATCPLALPNLWHLASDVTGTLADGSSALDLVAALHPTAAVAGSPTETATSLIAELEPFDRGRYAGPVGWVGADGDGEWAVALRCAQVRGTEVRAFAGAGIVAGSEPERELAETELKFRPILEAFSSPLTPGAGEPR